ncbi:CCA tRNA nucleotidyltransferase [Pararhodospirillum photometricum]|nr:CCA tRNA nucleotidyltransferase [Pararhodospirillum photometricum]
MTARLPRLEDRPPVGQLGPEPWLSAPATRAVLAALTAEGGQARFVGGCVRDALVHRPSNDIDIATTEPPPRVMALLEQAGIAALPTGLAHGTVTARVDGRSFEITTLRRDVACDGRHAHVAFCTSFYEDAKRRDFTINALSADAEGRVYDYFDGIADLAAGRVRFVGRAQDRLQEDFLRIMRYFRFHAWYGLPPADEEALAACASLAPGLDTLAGERVRVEMLRLLAAPDPAGVLALMQGRVLERLLPGVVDLAPLRVLVMLETRGLVVPGIAPDPLRRLAAALGAVPGGGTGHTPLDLPMLIERYRFSRSEARRLAALLDLESEHWPDPDRDSGSLRLLLDALGREVCRDRALLAWAAERVRVPFARSQRSQGWLRLLEDILKWDPPPFPLSGRDVLARGGQGPEVGRLLREVRRLWLLDGAVGGRDEALTWLEALGARADEEG